MNMTRFPRQRRCNYCGTPHSLTVDHIIPRSRGGTSAKSNLQILCVDCNGLKADNMPWEMWWRRSFDRRTKRRPEIVVVPPRVNITLERGTFPLSSFM